MIKETIFNSWRKHKGLIITAGIVVVIILIFWNPFKKEANGPRLEKVVMGSIMQEVAETGSVSAVQDLDLAFKASGRIARINVAVGDIVEKGAELAKLEINQAVVQLSQAQASLDVAKSQYDKLLAGSTPAEIKVVETAKLAAQLDLDEAYQDALNTAEDTYLKMYNAYNAVRTIRMSYFTASGQGSVRVQDNETLMGESASRVKTLLDLSKNNPTNENIDALIFLATTSLSSVSDALIIVRGVCEEPEFYGKVSAADKTILDNQRSYIVTSLSEVSSAKQTILSNKNSLQKAIDDLALKTAPPRQEDISYYQAKVDEAQSNVYYYQNQISDGILRAPVRATVTKIEKKVGETVQTGELLVKLMSTDPFQVKVDIYEEDVVKIKEGNLVDISIAAFSGRVFQGQVVAVDPAGKLVDGVVYYEVSVAFNEVIEGIKPGMTADVVIKTAQKENVLTVSKEAIRVNGGVTVLVLENGVQSEKEITIGLEGTDNKVEVLSGLVEGEEVIIR